MNEKNIQIIKKCLEDSEIPLSFNDSNKLQEYIQQNRVKTTKFKKHIKSILLEEEKNNNELQGFYIRINTEVLVNLNMELWEVIKLINNQ